MLKVFSGLNGVGNGWDLGGFSHNVGCCQSPNRLGGASVVLAWSNLEKYLRGD